MFLNFYRKICCVSQFFYIDFIFGMFYLIFYEFCVILYVVFSRKGSMYPVFVCKILYIRVSISDVLY